MRRFADTRVYIGNLEDAGDKELLKQNNIKVILNVCSDIDTPYNPDITLMKCGLDDPAETLAPQNCVGVAARILGMGEDLAQTRDGNILVHCAAGNNRSALVAAFWGRLYNHMHWDEAVNVAQVKDKKNWMINLGYGW